MQFHQYPNISTAEKSLRKRGYTTQFEFQNDQLRVNSDNTLFTAKQLILREYHRFIEVTNGRCQIIFAFSTTEGLKGILTINYSQRPDMKLISFIDKVPIQLGQQEL